MIDGKKTAATDAAKRGTETTARTVYAAGAERTPWGASHAVQEEADLRQNGIVAARIWLGMTVH